MDYKDFWIILISSSLGSGIRILRETQERKLTALKIVYFFICGIFLSYLAHGILKDKEWFAYFGQISAVIGIIAIDLIELIIKNLPKKIFDKINNKL